MQPYVYWFLLSLVMIIMEMATGTFYLLMLGIATAIGGLASLLQASFALQLMLSALTVIAGTVILRRLRFRTANRLSTSSLDDGQMVKVLSWHDDGTARVFYRGTEWDAEPEDSTTPHEATLYIKTMHGSTLILTQHKPH